jgi:3-oxoadipate enol-lactonase
MPFLSVDGLKTFYESEGKGRTLILIHGAGGMSSYWVNQLTELSKKLRVIAIDLPGHGKSERMKQKPTIERYVKHVAGFMKQIKLEKAVIAGHSMGGMVVQQLVLEHPKLVEKLIIIDSSAKFQNQGNLPDRIRDNPVEAGLELLNRLLSPKTLAEGNLSSLMKYFRVDADFDLSILADDFDALSGIDLSGKLRELKVPTLIVAGVDDMLASSSLLLHENIKGSKLEMIPEAGHMPMLEQPEKFNKIILEFLRV